MARTSKHTPNERLYRKRLAARFRQRRCRERQKFTSLAAESAAAKLDEKTADTSQATSQATRQQAHNPVENAAPAAPSQVPSSFPPRNLQVMHYPVPGHHSSVFRCMPHYPPPMYMPPPGMPMHMHHMGTHNRGRNFTAVRYPYPAPLMGRPQGPPPMPYSAPMPPPHGPSGGQQFARVVSRSSSESSIDSGSENRVYGGPAISVNEHCKGIKTNTCPKEKPLGMLGTNEKTAVAAILSLKDSSEEESCDDISSNDDFAVPSNLNNAFSQASTQNDHFDKNPQGRPLWTVAV
jgi:hypothetical protein